MEFGEIYFPLQFPSSTILRIDRNPQTFHPLSDSIYFFSYRM